MAGKRKYTKSNNNNNNDDVDYRKCLRCQEYFKSEWVGNRICNACKIAARGSRSIGGYDTHPLAGVRIKENGEW